MHYGHGDDAYQYQSRIIANFSSNVFWGGPPKGLKDYLFEQWELVHNYPEVLGETLQQKLAAHHGLTPEHILVTNGAVEAIYLIAQTYAKQQTAIFTPTFSEYEDACRVFEHQLDFLDHQSLFSEQGFSKLNAQLCFLCNPNNPNGKFVPKARILELLNLNPETLFVVDEAFIDFTPQPQESLVEDIQEVSNLIVLRSMTKIFAIPGLRLGYALSSKPIIEKLLTRKQPWSVNSLALCAGEYLIDNYPDSLPEIPALLRETRKFYQNLKSIEGLTVQESAAHFMLCDLKKRSASRLKADLANHHGILIRDASNFRGCNAGHFRLATLREEQNERLISCLKQRL